MTARHPIIQIPYKRWPQTAWRNIHRGVFRRGIDPDVQNLLNDMLSTLTDQAAEMEENNYLEIERSLERALYGITGLPVITVDATAGNPHNAQYTSLATAVASVSGGAIIIVRSTGGIFETLTVAASVENIVIMQSQPDAGAAANNVQFDHITGGAAGCVVTFLGCNVSFSNATSLDNGYTGQLSFVNCPVVSSTNTSGSIIGSVSTDLVAVDTSFLAGNPLLGAYNTAFVSNCIVQQLFTDAATISAATFSNCSIQGIAPFATTTITMTMANSSAKVRFVGCDFTTPTSTHTWSITYNSSTSSTQSIEFIGCNVNCKGATTISYTAMNDGSAWLMSGCTFQTRANTCAITHATTGKSSIVYSGVIGPQLSITQSGHTDTLFTASGVFRKITVATGGAIIDAQLDLNAASVTGIVVTGDGAVINASFVNFGAAAVGLNISGSNGIALLTCAGGTIATLFTNSGSGNNINSFPPNGAAGGDLTGTYPNPTLAGIITAGGPTGSTSVIPVITWDAKGRITALTSVTPTISTIGTPTGDVAWGANKITGVKDPTSAQDAMTKNYADLHYTNNVVGSTVVAEVYRNATQALTTATAAAISWDTALSDALGFWAASPNPTRLTVPVGDGGIFIVNVSITFAAHADSAQRQIQFKVNSNVVATVALPAINSGTVPTSMIVPLVFGLAAGDFVEVFCRQDSGGNLNVGGSFANANVTIARLFNT